MLYSLSHRSLCECDIYVRSHEQPRQKADADGLVTLVVTNLEQKKGLLYKVMKKSESLKYLHQRPTPEATTASVFGIWAW